MAMLSDLLVRLDRKRPRRQGPSFENPYLHGNFAPIGEEHDSGPLEVIQGQVPKDLRGALYRMSPAPRFAPVNPTLYHWFDGDGMIDAFHVRDGQVSHRNRWVRTGKLGMEERAGRALFGGIRDLATSTGVEGWLALGFSPGELLRVAASGLLGRKPSEEDVRRVLPVMDRSNTSIAWMAGRLLSLVEGSGAHEIEPETLETLGRFDFGGALDVMKGGMVAHPKIEPETGTIFTFGYWIGRGGLTYHVFGADGRVRVARDIETPYPAMMHDFSVTETRAVFYHLPAVLHMEDPRNSNTIRWEPSRGARIGVMAREGVGHEAEPAWSPDEARARVRWYEIPPCYVFHAMNAFDDGEAVVLDVVKYPRLPLFDPGGENPNARFEEYPAGRLTRIRLDLTTGEVRETEMDEAACEFPIVDPRRTGRRYRHGWVAARRGATCGRGIMNAIGHVDFETGKVDYRVLGRSTYTNEVLFVPRSPSAEEGDGYLITTVYHADQGECDLLLLDAQGMDREPVATVRTKRRVPYGFHGTWVPAG